jgi:hypothetical protein
MTLPDNFCIRYKKLPLDSSNGYQYRKVNNLYREIIEHYNIENSYNLTFWEEDIPDFMKLIKGDRNTALLNLRSDFGLFSFLAKEIIVNQNTFKLVKNWLKYE